MIELLRNCSNDTGVAVYLETDASRGKTIIKSATTPEGIRNLQNELAGWNFYQKIRYPHIQYPLCEITQQRDSYLKIRIEFIEGIKSDYRKGLVKNAHLINKTIDHYYDIWPCNEGEKTSVNGDLSLDNIIYNNDGIHIIDWEHFTVDAGPWGYDAVYLLYENLWFGMKGREEPSFEEIDIIGRNLIILKSTGRLSAEIINQPLSFLKKFILDNYKIWGEQLLIRPKLPILFFTDSQISKIDNLVRREI